MKKALVFTLLIETSPQALPLGAACISSSIKAYPPLKDKLETKLLKCSKEDEGFSEENAVDFCKKIILSSFSDAKNSDAVNSAGKKTSSPDQKAKTEGDGNCWIPDFILFSLFVWNRKILCQLSKKIKEEFPSVITIAGGPEVTSSPSSFSEFDYLVSGQGEEIAPLLLEDLISGKNFLSKNKILFGSVKDLGKLVSPYLSGEIKLSEYQGALWELARGCPFKCSYCYESKGEKKIRYFPEERLKKELDLFAKEKIRQVFVLDPTYNADKKRALSMLDLISKKAPDIFFYFEARAEFIDREMAKAFTKVRCALQFGLQSADREVLKLVKRSLDKKVFSRNIGYLNECGVVFGFDLIYGLPGDSLDGFKKSIDYAISLYPNNLETFCLSVLPGTSLYDEAESLSLVWQKEAPYHVIRTDKFSEKDMKNASFLSLAVSFLYNQARSVPFFNSMLYYFNKKPSAFFEDFYKWVRSNGYEDFVRESVNLCSKSHLEIEELVIKFIKDYLNKRSAPEKCVKAFLSIIRMNGALSRLEESGKEETINVDFYPDDLMSEAAFDIRYFSKYAKECKCKVRVFLD
nr:radical SAM protein [Treponema sp.]